MPPRKWPATLKGHHLAEPLDRYDAELTTPDMVILELDATDKLDAAKQLARSFTLPDGSRTLRVPGARQRP